MSWFDRIAKIIGRWIAPDYFPKPGPIVELDIDAKVHEAKIATTKEQYGVLTKTIDIRILYPECQGELKVADIYSELIYARLQLLKEQSMQSGYDPIFKNIGEIRKSYQDGSSTYQIEMDIQNKNCFVIIVLTKDCASINKKGAYIHDYFMHEMNLVKQTAEKNYKNNLFYVFYIHEINRFAVMPDTIIFLSKYIKYQLTTTKEGVSALDKKLRDALAPIWNC